MFEALKHVNLKLGVLLNNVKKLVNYKRFLFLDYLLHAIILYYKKNAKS